MHVMTAQKSKNRAVIKTLFISFAYQVVTYVHVPKTLLTDGFTSKTVTGIRVPDVQVVYLVLVPSQGLGVSSRLQI